MLLLSYFDNVCIQYIIEHRENNNIMYIMIYNRIITIVIMNLKEPLWSRQSLPGSLPVHDTACFFYSSLEVKSPSFTKQCRFPILSTIITVCFFSKKFHCLYMLPSRQIIFHSGLIHADLYIYLTYIKLTGGIQAFPKRDEKNSKNMSLTGVWPDKQAQKHL